MYVSSTILTLLCFLEIAYAEQETVKVSLYYESMCPFSNDFITEDLFPVYERLGEALIIDLVPYGKANQTYIDGKWKFECQHGPKECFGNKLQACVLNKTLNGDNEFKFVNCISNSSSPWMVENGEKCASDNNIDWSSVSRCFSSPEGDSLLAHYGDRTRELSPKLTYIPHILFNGVFNQTAEEDARCNFFKTVCSLFIVKPRSCE